LGGEGKGLASQDPGIIQVSEKTLKCRVLAATVQLSSITWLSCCLRPEMKLLEVWYLLPGKLCRGKEGDLGQESANTAGTGPCLECPGLSSPRAYPAFFSRAFLIEAFRSLILTGLGKKSSTSSRSASMATSRLAKAVIMITTVLG
jgi:hypothetical protein